MQKKDQIRKWLKIAGKAAGVMAVAIPAILEAMKPDDKEEV